MDDLIPTRATLLERLKDWQDQASWHDFFETYWRLIYRVALKAGLSEVEAQEVVQETMISVAKRMPTFEYDPAIGSFKGWLLGLTRWRIADQFRRRGAISSRPRSSWDTTADDCAPQPLPEQVEHTCNAIWDAEWKDNMATAAISKVRRRCDPQNYQMFDLYVTKQWAPERVAATFGVRVAHVYLVKHRVTEMIREEVQRLEKQMT